MDISSLYNITSSAIRSAYGSGETGAIPKATIMDESQDVFGSFLDSAIKNINSTNAYISNAENENIRFAMQKASTAMSYNMAVRDKFLEAYKEIMNIQI